MHWYLIYTKPKQEKCALQNLLQQGYVCYLPCLLTEKIRHGNFSISEEPLFPRYLFIQLDSGSSSKSWSPIRSTKGVCQLVRFGAEPTKVDCQLISLLKKHEDSMKNQRVRVFSSGERVCITGGAFAGIEGVYEMAGGESRAMVLIELLSKSVRLSLSPAHLQKVG